MTNSKFVQITKDQNGREAVIVRVDKTVKDWMEEKPASRWDPKYWHPKYDYLTSLAKISSPLLNYLQNKGVISADTIRASRGESYKTDKDQKHPHLYLSVTGIRPTGYDYSLAEYGSENAYQRLKRSELEKYDIAIARSGTGSLGKCFLFSKENTSNIVSDLYIIRCIKEKISPFYLLILLKSMFGSDQIERNEKGVSGQTKITTGMIENFLVPIISPEVQKHIESEYKKMSGYHDKAMEGKKKGDEVAYKKNIETAEKMLKDLIARTEAVIRGERKDII